MFLLRSDLVYSTQSSRSSEYSAGSFLSVISACMSLRDKVAKSEMSLAKACAVVSDQGDSGSFCRSC